ncbi:MAG: DsbA family protein [Pacificimonas sp.]|jgi:protein-disulfide isomerase|nr:DsbA family protein [Pacificimonas sp.]
MTKRLTLIAAAAAALFLGALIVGNGLGRGDPAQADVSDATRAEIEQIVREYILANPEIIPEAIAELRNREARGQIAANREALETPFESAWAGAPDGDVVLVEFYDYACPFCRRANADVQRLLAEDDRLKVVWRDMPVLGAASREAAEASLAAAKVGRFREYHDAMYADPRRVSEDKIYDVAAEAGLSQDMVDAAGRDPEIRQEIDRNLALGRALGATGTPAYIIGDRRLDGAVGYEALKEAVAAARAGN